MKHLHTFEEFLNESKLNEAFAKLNLGSTLDKVISDTKDGESWIIDVFPDSEDVNIKVMKKGYESIASLLGGSTKNVSMTMSEEDEEFSISLNNALPERFKKKDPNIQKLGETTIGSPLDSASTSIPVTCYLIKDVNIKVAIWEDGDDFLTYPQVAFLSKDAKDLLKWVNKNLSELDL